MCCSSEAGEPISHDGAVAKKDIDEPGISSAKGLRRNAALGYIDSIRTGDDLIWFRVLLRSTSVQVVLADAVGT